MINSKVQELETKLIREYTGYLEGKFQSRANQFYNKYYIDQAELADIQN